MVRELFKKADYKPISIDGNKVHLMWNKEDITEKVYQTDSDGNQVLDVVGNPIVLSENETDYCTACHVTVDAKTPLYALDNMFSKGAMIGYNNPTVKERGEWLNHFPFSIDSMRNRLLGELEEYDSSNKVNQFTINGINLWLDSNMRDKVRENLASCDAEGIKETTLRIDGMAFTVSVETGWAMYNALLSYARKCWNNTEKHREAINKLSTMEEIIAYDYTVGYPEKLHF